MKKFMYRHNESHVNHSQDSRNCLDASCKYGRFNVVDINAMK